MSAFSFVDEPQTSVLDDNKNISVADAPISVSISIDSKTTSKKSKFKAKATSKINKFCKNKPSEVKSDPVVKQPPRRPSYFEEEIVEPVTPSSQPSEMSQLYSTFCSVIEKKKEQIECLSHLNAEYEEALTSEKYEKANSISDDIAATKASILETDRLFYKLMDEALENATNNFPTPESAAPEEIEPMRNRYAQQCRLLNDLFSKQAADRATMTITKQKCENDIQIVRKSKEKIIGKHNEQLALAHSEKFKELTELVHQFEKKQSIINDLEKKLQSEKEESLKIQRDIEKVKSEMTLDENSDIERVFRAKIEEQNKKEDEILLPVKTLELSIKTRESQIQEIKSSIEREKEQIKNCEFQTATYRKVVLEFDKLKQIYKNHISVSDKLRNDFEEKTSLLNTNTVKLMKSTIRKTKLQDSIKNDQVFLEEMNSKMSVFDSMKTAATNVKDYRKANNAANQVKDMLSLTKSVSDSLADTQVKLNEQAKEVEEIENEAKVYKEEAEISKVALDKHYFQFLQDSASILVGLSEISPELRESLKPLHSIITKGFEITKPKVTEEAVGEVNQKISALQQKIEEAVEREMYEEAAKLQDQIDALSLCLKSL